MTPRRAADTKIALLSLKAGNSLEEPLIAARAAAAAAAPGELESWALDSARMAMRKKAWSLEGPCCSKVVGLAGGQMGQRATKQAKSSAGAQGIWRAPDSVLAVELAGMNCKDVWCVVNGYIACRMSGVFFFLGLFFVFFFCPFSTSYWVLPKSAVVTDLVVAAKSGAFTSPSPMEHAVYRPDCLAGRKIEIWWENPQKRATICQKCFPDLWRRGVHG